MFKEQTVIISGGAGDIGMAVADKFASLGADIALGDIKPVDQCQALLQRITNYGVRCHYTTVDISDASQTEQWIQTVTAELTAPSIIIANAAITRLAGFQETSTEQWVNDIGVNVNGAFFLTKYATQQLLE